MLPPGKNQKANMTQMTLSTPNEIAIHAPSIQFVFAFMLPLAWT